MSITGLTLLFTNLRLSDLLQTALEKTRDDVQKEKSASDAKVKELEAKIKSLENSTKSQKTASNDSEVRLCNMRLCEHKLYIDHSTRHHTHTTY